MSVDHIVLTRFNLPSASVEGLIRARDGWLTKRVGLFDAYCLPSMRAQTCRNFHWIIYFDPESPDWLKTWIAERHPGAFTPIFRASVSRAELITDARAVIGGEPASELITTNLDNDDGVAVDFIERLQGAETRGRTALYLGNGLIRSRDALYLRRDPVNAFCSVREPWEGAVTCWADWHNRLGRSMASLALTGAPGWLQVIHDDNVSNRIRGRRVSPAAYGRLFPQLLDGLQPFGLADMLRDRVLGQTRRAAFEAGRAIAKHATLLLFGKDGPDRMKQWSRRLLHRS